MLASACFKMVAGARYVVEKKIPGCRIDFDWGINELRPARRHLSTIDVTRCAA